MKKSTRVLSLLLVLVMVFALMPTFTVEAKAEEDINWQNTEIKNPDIVQFGKEYDSGDTPSGNNYNLEVTLQRHIANGYTSGTEFIDRGYGDSNIFIIPHVDNGKVVQVTIHRDQADDYRGKSGKTDINRWWRWASWYDDNTNSGIYAKTTGSKKHITGKLWYDELYVCKRNDTRNLSIDGHNGDYYIWTGGAFDGVDYARVYVPSSLPINTKKVELRSANGTQEQIISGMEVACSWVDDYRCRPGDQGKHVFAIGESSTVIYRLDGGTWGGSEKDVGYYTWSTGDKTTSQLHDIIQEPSKEGYTFLGWECVENGGNTNLKEGGVYQPYAVNQYNKTANSATKAGAISLHDHSLDGDVSKGCIAVTGDTEFKALWVKNEFTIEHVQNGTLNTSATEKVDMKNFGSYEVVAYDQIKQFKPNANNALDITAKTKAGYLYGGTFKNDYETVADFNGGKATKFTPEAEATYYIWEVPVQHLQPTILGVFEKEGSNYNVIESYAASAIDRLQYQEAGFIVNGNKYISKDSDVNALFEKIGVKSTKSGGARDYTYNQLNPKFTDVKSDALLSCIKFPVPATGSPTTVVPYWITLDGQTVYGIKQATVQYNNAGPDYINMALTVTYQDYPVVLKSFAAPRMNAAPMMLMSTFSMNSDATPEPDEIGETIVPDEPEVPVVPDEPEVPEVPDEPEVPDVPEEPEVPVVPESKPELTVSDGANVYEVEITDDLALTPAGQDGKLFAGWFSDPACTVAADLSAVEDGDAVFAKYVSNKYLQVKYNATFTLLSKTVSLTSAVDGKNFAETGYVISTKNGDKTVVVNKYATKFALQDAKQLFGATKGAPLMNVDYKLSGLSKNDTVTITPYWITADGTTVFGTARTLTYTGLTIRG